MTHVNGPVWKSPMARKFAAGVIVALILLVAIIRWHKPAAPSPGNGSDKSSEHGAASQSSGALNPASVPNVAGKVWGMKRVGLDREDRSGVLTIVVDVVVFSHSPLLEVIRSGVGENFLPLINLKWPPPLIKI